MGRADATRPAHETRSPPVGLTHDPVRRRGRLVRPQCLAGRRHVRPLPGRSRLGQRQLAGVLRRLPARPGPRPAAPGTGPGRRTKSPSTGAAAPAAAAPAPAPVVPAATEEATPLRGAASRIVANMEASLAVPTATSVRTVPARLLEVNRLILNNQLARTTGAKVSFTHIIGYAVVRALHDVPALNAAFVADADGTGKPGVIHHKHVGLGLAVDQEKSDGSRTLLVPCIKDADTLDFRSFVLAYEDLIRKIHTNKIAPDDFAGTTVSLTNPGTLGTVQSVPRLMPGQGAIIGVGALGYPAGFEAADPRVLAQLGLGKVVTLTSTYDHRIIQGAESGLFLGRVAALLTGADGFYDDSVRVDGRALRARPLAGRQQRRRRQRRRRAPAPRQAGARADAHQHVPGARPPHRPPRPPRRRAPAHPPRARPADLRAHHLGPAAPVRRRRPGRARRRHARRDPPRAARRLLPDARHRVHAHSGSRAEALDPAARRGPADHASTWRSNGTSSAGSTPPRSSSASSTPATSGRSGSASRARSRPSSCSTRCSTPPRARGWPRS